MEFSPSPAIHRVLCADCGTPIEPNSANLCIPCLRNSVDITEGIPKQATVNFCRNCERFLSPPNTWTIAEPESRELLAICLKKLKGLNKVRLIDASFIWTEPHSKRLRLKLTIQKEVFTSTILQQIFEIEYVVVYGQCPDCTKLAAKNTWKAVIQVRQKVAHKRTFLYLEQLILKHSADKDTISVKETREGLDFFYAQRSHAIKMVEFLNSVVPVRTKDSERLLSRDIHSNTSNYKFTYSVEIVPVCKDDLVCIPKALARSSGNIAQLTVCVRVGSAVQLMDFTTLQTADIASTIYWRAPFESICSSSDLVEFVVLDIEPSGPVNGKYVLADAQVVLNEPSRSGKGGKGDMEIDEEGSTDMVYHTRTHLGRHLNAGDTVKGYFLRRANINNAEYESLDQSRLPDVVLVKKSYPNRRKKNRHRNWKLKSIAKEAEEGPDAFGRGALGRRGGLDSEKVERDYEAFLRDLEEDPELRATVNLYKTDVKMKGPSNTKGPSQTAGGADSMDLEDTTNGSAGAMADTEDTDNEVDEPDFPEITPNELLDAMDELTLDDRQDEGVESGLEVRRRHHEIDGRATTSFGPHFATPATTFAYISAMAWRSHGKTNIELIMNMQSNGLIKSSRVAEALKKVDRANYVLDKTSAYRDAPQSIDYGATISAPHMHAHAAENLLDFLQPGMKVLDVGSGSGYTCALFHHLVSPADGSAKPGKVVGIDHIKELVDWSVGNLKADGLVANTPESNIEMVCGDGRKGYPPGAPYNAIHVGAAAPTLPQELIDQLAKPGRMFIPVEDGTLFGGQSIWQVDKDEQGNIAKSRLFGVQYVPLTDAERQWKTR
ncbi:hypothetical protein FRB99_005241 [Tulasnella sp. 403]|nr:hypothetical protein FRB99_005241 [Tulasnella sp. 403]